MQLKLMRQVSYSAVKEADYLEEEEEAIKTKILNAHITHCTKLIHN